MVRILELLRDTANTSEFQFVDEQRRANAKFAFERGIECILKCQIMVDGMRTVWCAQHDESDYQPRPARAYELVSLSGAESAGVLKLLMSLEKPSSEIRQAIHAGAAWFESAKISGIRVDKIGGDTVVVKDPKSRPMWARFYEIETNRPFFCGRDGLRKYQLSEIESERRNGYSWYGSWGNEVAEHYGHWKQKWGSADAGG
jgi:pectate lyase